MAQHRHQAADEPAASAGVRGRLKRRLQRRAEHKRRDAWPDLVDAAPDSSIPSLHSQDQMGVIHLRRVGPSVQALVQTAYDHSQASDDVNGGAGREEIRAARIGRVTLVANSRQSIGSRRPTLGKSMFHP